MKIVKKENFINKIEINNKIDYNEIFNYKYNNIDVSILLREPKVIKIPIKNNEIDLYFYVISEKLLEDILQNYKEINPYIYNYLNEIITKVENFEEKCFTEFNKESISLNNGESDIRNQLGKIMLEIKNRRSSVLYGKLLKKMKMLKNIGKLFNQGNIRLLHKNNNKNTIRIKLIQF